MAFITLRSSIRGMGGVAHIKYRPVGMILPPAVCLCAQKRATLIQLLFSLAQHTEAKENKERHYDEPAAIRCEEYLGCQILQVDEASQR